jgi:hypothetical protein
MSGTVTAAPYAAYSTGLLSDQEKQDVREFCGFPLYGNGNVIFPFPWINKYYLALETRMNSLQPAELQRVRMYLTTLYGLDAAIPGATVNLDTDIAAVWTHNKSEVPDRSALLAQWRRRLCSFMGVPPGPELNNSGIRFIV